MPLIKKLEIPRSEARLRWAAKIKATLDPEILLGAAFTGAALTGAAALGAIGVVEQGLLDVGTVESLDFIQNRKIRERFRLGELQAFQNIPQNLSNTLRLSRVALKKMPDVERFFSFLPSNIVLQQLPLVMELTDVGDGGEDTQIRHFIFGCWFTESTLHFDVTSRQDARLIQNATVTATHVLTFDQSVAGNPVVQAASLTAQAILEATGSEEAVENLEI